MSSPFAARRKARVVGQEDEGSETASPMDESEQEPFVKRPSSKAKKRSSMRVSFGLGGTSMAEDDSTAEVFTPKRSNLSRQAMEKNALKRAGLATSISRDDIPSRQNELRPSYSKEDLAALRSSTPSTPRNERSGSLEAVGPAALDLASKFGTSLTRYEQIEGISGIPTNAEIQEKKARRARLAQENKWKGKSESGESDMDVDDFRSNGHDSDEDEFRNQHDTISIGAFDSKTPQTRLAPDDEDMMEDFDSFVDDGRITLGRRAEQEQKRRHKAEMRELIEDAEGSSTDDSDDSEKERRAAYEAAQTRKGMEGLRVGAKAQGVDTGAHTPPRITPLPSLSACQERLQQMLMNLEASLAQKIRQLEEIEQEKREIAESEGEIQRLLDETAERYKQLMGDRPAQIVSINGGSNQVNGDAFGTHRGLESMGGTPLRIASGAPE